MAHNAQVMWIQHVILKYMYHVQGVSGYAKDMPLSVKLFVELKIIIMTYVRVQWCHVIAHTKELGMYLLTAAWSTQCTP